MVQCDICWHKCVLQEQQVGKCSVRTGTPDGTSLGLYSNLVSCLAFDNIEKRPFFHVLPGEKFLSCGFNFCNFSCDFCINFSISQQFSLSDITSQNYISPLSLVSTAFEKKASGIVFTYNEPTIYKEYLLEVGRNATATPLILAIKTNGFATHRTMRALLPFYDAFNVDIKGDDKFYESACSASWQPVKENIENLVKWGAWVEISYLVNPVNVDNRDWHTKIAEWLRSLNSSIPVHLLYFFPFHKMKETYPIEKILDVYNIFRQRLYYVYISNSFDSKVISHRDTVCPNCGKVMISRSLGTKIHKTKCCNSVLPGILRRKHYRYSVV